MNLDYTIRCDTPAELADLIARHRRIFGGWRMDDDDKGGDGAGDDGKGGDKGGDKYTPPATQADLDRIIGDRLARQAESKFGDYEDLRAKAAAHDKTLQDAMSDAEKAAAKAREEGASEATTKANARLVTSEARALAAEAKFRNPSLAVKAIDLSGVKVGDDGEPDAAAIRARLKELSDADPYLLDDGKNSKVKPDHSQGGGDGDSASSVQKGRDLYAERHPNKKAS